MANKIKRLTHTQFFQKQQNIFRQKKKTPALLFQNDSEMKFDDMSLMCGCDKQNEILLTHTRV